MHVAECKFLDRVGYMGNDLHGRAQIVAASFFLDHVGINTPGRHVVGFARRHAGETLVVAEIEIGLRTVVSDENLAVLGRAHGARVDIEIGVQFAQPHLVPARLQKRRERRRCQAFAE